MMKRTWVIISRLADYILLHVGSRERAVAHRMTHDEAKALGRALNPLTIDEIMAAIERQPFARRRDQQLFSKSQVMAGITEVLGER